jgi:hypothetical protein
MVPIGEEDGESVPEMKPIIPFVINATFFDLNLLYLNPTEINIYSEPTEIYSATIHINTLPFNNMFNYKPPSKDAFFTITNIK